jgi:hypothetical protein
MHINRSGISRLVVVALIASIAMLFVTDMPLRTVSAGHTFTTSSGIYRVPYFDGLTVTAFNDHHNHTSVLNRVDMGSGKGSIMVAAASGIIRGIVDRHGNDYGRGDGLGFDLSTPQVDGLEDNCSGNGNAGLVQGGSCANYNNYV